METLGRAAGQRNALARKCADKNSASAWLRACGLRAVSLRGRRLPRGNFEVSSPRLTEKAGSTPLIFRARVAVFADELRLRGGLQLRISTTISPMPASTFTPNSHHPDEIPNSRNTHSACARLWRDRPFLPTDA